MKKNIKNRIYFSHITVIIIFLLLTAFIFNIILSIYVRRQTRAQLITAVGLVKKSMSADLFDFKLGQDDGATEDKEAVKALLTLNKTLKQTEFFLDINYALIGKDQKLIHTFNMGNKDSALLQREILPVLARTRRALANQKEDRVYFFRASGMQYAATLYPLKLENNKNIGHLLIYSDLSQRDRMVMVVNAILFSILLITAIISFILSNALSKKISYPISRLSKFAKQIGERNYNFNMEKFDDDEIGQLAETMKSMAHDLYAYDNTVKTFLQNASHELRTPLMSIQGYAEGIKYEVVDDRDGAVDIIIEESKRLSKLVDDLLYLSKIDALQETLNVEHLDAEDLIRSCIEKVNGIAVSRGIDINFSSGSKTIGITADEEKLSRAVINVLGNCLRYGKQKIDIILEKEENEAVLKIMDDGSGFDQNDLSNIFERFYKGKGGNYGLGLTITKAIIEKHGGSITAQNRPEGGASFIIRIPLDNTL